MNSLWAQILAIGQSPDLTTRVNRKVAIMNRIAAPFLMVLFLYMLIFFFNENYKAVRAIMMSITLLLLPIYFNYKKKYHIGIRLFMPFLCIVLFAIAFKIGQASNVEFSFFLLLIGGFIFSDQQRERTVIQIIGFTGFIATNLIYRYTEPLIIYPYPFLLQMTNGLLIGFVCFQMLIYFKDETEKNEKAILSSREKYRALFQGALDAVVTINQEGQVTQWNEQATAIFGYKPEEVCGRNWEELVIPPKYQSIYQSGLKRAIKTGTSSIFHTRKEVLGMNNRGRVFPMEISVTPILHEGRYVFNAFLRDITHKKEAESKLMDMNQELRQFASVASHDMKEPLRTISSFSTLLERKIPENKETKEFLYYIKDASKRMTRLLEDLISYARAGTSAGQMEEIALNDTLTIVKNNLYNLINNNQAVIESNDLPTIYGQQTHFLQLFQNLISNGIKYHREEVNPKIVIQCRPLHNGWEISISDNGIGMKEEYLKRIFEPFTRLHTRREFEGSGIGLAICKKIVDQYKGQISVRSTEGSGTTFYIQLPRLMKTPQIAIPVGVLKEN
jgi:PAS domain S-box-containing protein